MSNILDYARDVRESFEEKPFGEVDSLILCQLSNLQLSGICDGERETTILQLAQKHNSDALYHGIWVPRKTRRLLTLLADNPRFSGIRLRYFIEEYDAEREMQFAALTYTFGQRSYLAFRGTDMTLIGWKEDFNMAHTFPVPAQKAGAVYLRSIASKIEGDILLGGHSKGGNIAIYAAYEAEDAVLSRINAIYCHDSPGFKDLFYDARFRLLAPRILKTLPRSSLIGMILCHQCDYSIVKSRYPGFLQHNPFTWQVKDGEFYTTTALSRYAKLRNRALNRWINALSIENRRLFVDTIFGVMIAAGAKTFSEFLHGIHHRIAASARFVRRLDGDAKRTVFRVIATLVRESLRALRA